MTVKQVARVAHEINRAYCLAIGDDSQPAWKDAPEWQKSSAVNGVRFHMANPDAGPDASHNSWLKQKQDEGWKYGPVKNPETKEHPCFVPYEELPVEQRAKDYLFRQIVHSLQTIPAMTISHLTEGTGTFGDALHAAKVGMNVARTGWNGVGMYAVIMPGYPDGIACNEATAKTHNVPVGTTLKFRPYWQLKTAQNDIAMWTPSGSDTLAEDWTVIP